MPTSPSPRWADAPFTYPEVGATEAELPAGYDHQDRARLLGRGRALFDEASERLLHWEVQTGAGLRVRSDAAQAVPGAVVVVAAGLGPLRLWSPCRVVQVVDEPDRRGFSYGTLPTHPEVGEESFMITIDEHDQVWIRIRAFSRPGPWWARTLSPALGLAQRFFTNRYLRALDH